MIAEGRKYALRLRVANQSLSQIPGSLRDTVLNNVGPVPTFRSGPADTHVLDGLFPIGGKTQILPR